MFTDKMRAPTRNIIACFANSYGRFGLRGALEHLPTVGVDYVELPVRTSGVATQFGDEPLLTDCSNQAALEHVDRLLHSHGVRVASCNITSGNPLDPSVVAITKRKLDVASHFGVAHVVANAGAASTPAEFESLYGNLADIADYAAARGITYCCETHPGLCGDARSMLTTMAAVNHPHLRLNFDTANILYYNEHVDGEISLARVCAFVRHVHLKDFGGQFGCWDFPALGSGGAVNFVRVLEILRVQGFRGPYSIEIEGTAGEPEPTLDQYQQRVADSVRYLRMLGYFD